MEEVTFEFCLGGCVGVSQTENGDYRRGAAGAKAWTVSRGGPFGEAGAQL